MSPGHDPAEWARTWRGPMLRFASLHLQPREDAEDAVQDALAAMLAAAPDTWRGVADPKRYLFGILKHKITDRLRQRYRGEVARGDVFTDDLDELLFDARGHWADGMAPALWSQPDERLHTGQFFAVVDLCLTRLPPKPARVFSMKELLECDAEEVCATLGLTRADYWQCMSRARKQIQLCLTQHWFAGAAR